MKMIVHKSQLSTNLNCNKSNRLFILRPSTLSLIALFTFHLSPFTALAALPQTRSEPCPACHGRKSVSLTPPNLGQFDGEIGVTQGKPFRTHRFDVRHDKCPLCNGTGRHERWTPATPPEDKTGLAPCIDCLSTGVAPCQKCKKTGYVQCNKCQSDKSKKPGWILTEERTSGRTSRHVKKIVSPCGTCGGIGKVECSACEGRGGTICKKCSGEGFVPRKERK